MLEQVQSVKQYTHMCSNMPYFSQPNIKSQNCHIMRFLRSDKMLLQHKDFSLKHLDAFRHSSKAPKRVNCCFLELGHLVLHVKQPLSRHSSVFIGFWNTLDGRCKLSIYIGGPFLRILHNFILSFLRILGLFHPRLEQIHPMSQLVPLPFTGVTSNNTSVF